MSGEEAILNQFGFGPMQGGLGGFGAVPGEDIIAHAGDPMPGGTATASAEAMIEAMKTVHDPEIPVNIYDLGLIYTCDIAENGTVTVDMSLTAPGCPVAGILPQQVADALAVLEGVGEVTVSIVWDPPWTTDRMSDDAKLALDIM